jgi:hypothetical protein
MPYDDRTYSLPGLTRREISRTISGVAYALQLHLRFAGDVVRTQGLFGDTVYRLHAAWINKV